MLGQNYAESKASPQASQWSGVRLNEKRSLHKHQVIERRKIPVGAKVLISRYVYKIKHRCSQAIQGQAGRARMPAGER
jgi:hypothetical protein